ncbi:hypothetical protein M2311_005697 [Rhizobium leguminosarum]|nr:hypothetical protein [Rhizobium leguminosarum]
MATELSETRETSTKPSEARRAQRTSRSTYSPETWRVKTPLRGVSPFREVRRRCSALPKGRWLRFFLAKY